MRTGPARPTLGGTDGTTDLGQIVDLPVAALVPASDNPRRGRGGPLLVTPDGDDRYRIVCGERRWAAAVRAGLDSVQCVVCAHTEVLRHEAMLVEHARQSDLSRNDEALAYARLMDLGLSQRDIAGRVGRSQAHISRRLRQLTPPGETSAPIC